MIIPDFKLQQTQHHVLLFIRLPYIKVNSSEFYIEHQLFKFYLKPYLLSLQFTHPLKTTDAPSKAIYYHQKHILECHLEKEVQGQHFQNLELMTSVLNKKERKKANKVLVQVVGGKKVVVQCSNGRDEYAYGFGLNYKTALDDLQEQRFELFGFDPRRTAYCGRLELSQAIVSKQFSVESYLFDKYDNQQQIECLLSNKQSYAYLEGLLKQSKDIFSQYNQKGREGKEILLDAQFKQSIMKQIFSILFSYIYELISMNGQFGPQSPKTINNTSLVLNSNYLYTQTSYQRMLINCYRRCLTFSLYKHLKICQLARAMALQHLTTDYIRLMFIDLASMFEKAEPRYLLNRLYIDDYLRYLNEFSMQSQIKQCWCELQDLVIGQSQVMLKIEQFEAGQFEQQDSGEQQSQQKCQDVRLMKQYDQLIRQMQDLETLD